MTWLVQRFVYRGSSHRHKGSTSFVINMVAFPNEEKGGLLPVQIISTVTKSNFLLFGENWIISKKIYHIHVNPPNLINIRAYYMYSNLWVKLNSRGKQQSITYWY